MGTGEHLMFSAPGSIHCHAFAAQFIGQCEGSGHIHGCRGRREIDRFGYPAVAVSLKDGLHPDMLCRSDIVCSHKQPAKIIWNLRQMLNRFVPTDLFT